MSADLRSPLAVCPLASGSKGNSYWIEWNGTTLLVDAGVSLRQLTQRAEEMGRRIEEVDHVFITHEHGDHVKGLAQLLKCHHPTLWATRGTLRAIRSLIPDGASVRMLNSKEEQAGGFAARAVAVSHDAAEPVAYRFDVPGASLAVVTDLGEWDQRVAETVVGADILVCEANHDPHMLANGPYPWVLKQRISGRLGHLSNDAGARLASESVARGTRCVLLGHLSQSNNSRSLALDVFSEGIERVGGQATLDVASQIRPGPWIEVSPRTDLAASSNLITKKHR